MKNLGQNKNIYRMLRTREDKSPMVYLTVDRKKRVLEAIDDGLSKYLPKKKTNFSAIVHLIEKMMESKESKEEILKKIDLPDGKSYIRELEKEAEEKKRVMAEEKLHALRQAEKEEQEMKNKAEEAKEVFISQTSNIRVEEIPIPGTKEVKFDQKSEASPSLSRGNKTTKSKFVKTSSVIPETSATSKPHDRSSADTKIRFKVPKTTYISQSNRSGIRTPLPHFSNLAHSSKRKQRASTSMSTTRPCFYQRKPFSKEEFFRELQIKEDK